MTVVEGKDFGWAYKRKSGWDKQQDQPGLVMVRRAGRLCRMDVCAKGNLCRRVSRQLKTVDRSSTINRGTTFNSIADDRLAAEVGRFLPYSNVSQRTHIVVGVQWCGLGAVA